jgi:peptidyl-prolyl cis-trans isomerase C
MNLGFLGRVAKPFSEPLVQFFIIAALIYAAFAFTGGLVIEDNRKKVTITAGEITWLQDVWKVKWKRAPTDRELTGIVKQLLRERVLSSEAIAMGLDKEDVVIRRRLMQKLEYLSQDLLGGGTPSDEQLAAFFAQNAKAYEAPAVVTMSHVFFDPDKRGDQALEEANTQKAVLASLKVGPTDSRNYGDPFLLQRYYPERTYAELAKLLGTGFTDTLKGLSVGQWHGPVLSGYGVHLVYVHNRQKARPAKLADVKDRTIADWQNKTRIELSEKYLAGLLESYQVSIESQTPALKALEQSGAKQ